MIDYEEKRSETRHRMGFMTPLLVFVLAFVACCGVIACVFLRAAVISGEGKRRHCAVPQRRRGVSRGRDPRKRRNSIFHKRYGKLCESGRLLLYRNRSDRRRDRNGSVVCRENHGVHGGAG